MTDKTELSVAGLFGLEYWPALPAFLISTADEAGTPHLAPYSLVFFPSYTNVAEDKDTPKVISLVIGDYDTFAGAKESRTYRNITNTKEFVVNVPTAKYSQPVEYHRVSGRGQVCGFRTDSRTLGKNSGAGCGRMPGEL